ncbi:MAG: hypothetical protein NT069_27515, partial [Planctomycetota bacterium]|nr:hypothetical protein [Planctomycetota bacterium]
EFPAYSDMTIHLGGPPDEQSAAAKDVLKRWRSNPPAPAPGRKRVLLDDTGKLIDPEMSRLMRLRDNNGIELAE